MSKAIERQDPDYPVATCPPGALTEDELSACVDLVSNGGAVPRHFARRGLQTTTRLALVRQGGRIVGVGALKQVRPDYAKGRAVLSGFEFPADAPEVGYIARDPAARGNAPQILAALVEDHTGPLWATTDSEGMKAALTGAGFVRRGLEWRGGRGQLSLWIKRGRAEPAPV